MKKIIAFAMALCMLASLAGCGGNAPPPEQPSSSAPAESGAEQTVAGDLVLYSTMTENDLDTLLGLLDQKFPDLNIEVVNGTAGELTARIAAEKNNPQGDMMWGGLDASDGDSYTDLFEHWLSDYEGSVPEEYKSPFHRRFLCQQ